MNKLIIKKAGMINSIQSNYGKTKVSFGMAQFRNLEALTKYSKMSPEASEAITKSVKNACNGEKDIIVTLLSPDKYCFGETLRAFAEKDKGSVRNFLRTLVPEEWRCKYIGVEDIGPNAMEKLLNRAKERLSV